jgi:N-methylhydantoinase A
VALIQDGRPHYATGERIGDFAIHIPSVSVSSIGAGGGTIARVDEFGVLKVGPESAGSNPGPACYGRGGTRPTVTDAFVALGWLGHSELGYSAVTVDRDKSVAAIAPVAERLGVDVPRAAQLIVDVAVSGMFAESSGVLSRNGVDPKSLAVIAFGGAGPMMAGFLARELRVGRVVVPRVPGVLSALGGLIADLKNDFMRTVYATLEPATLPVMAQVFAELEAAGLDWLRKGQGHDGPAVIQRSA